MDLKGIIFDMDGVIVDTEYQDFLIQKDFICQLNPKSNYKDSELLILVGKSYLTLYKLLQNFIGDHYDIETIEKEYAIFSDRRYKILDYRTLFRTEILEIIDYSIQNGIKLAVASSSKYDHINSILEICNIKQYFDVVISGENFVESKPNPSIYFTTLDKLNLSANQCIAIEDSYSGIEASTNAGIPTIGYFDSRLPLFNDKANWKVENMREVLQIILSRDF